MSASRAGYKRMVSLHGELLGRSEMIVLGIVVLLLGLLLGVPILWTIGLVLVIVGAALWIAGSAGHTVGGRRHYY
jgi:fatty-acid desaturase